MKKEDFIQWLKDNHAYDKFKDNYYKCNNVYKTSVIEWLDTYNWSDLDSYIDVFKTSFSWADSNESFEYWKALNREWEQYIFVKLN